MNFDKNEKDMSKVIEDAIAEGFKLRTRLDTLNEQEKERFEKICHLLERTKAYYDGTWVTLNKQRYHLYRFYLFKPHPNRHYKTAGELEPYGLYNPDTKEVDTSAIPPKLPSQKDWPW
jgi:hypothetical protein